MQFQRTAENAQNDEAFLTLLSSQRELLSQLNRENATRTSNQGNANSPPVGRFGSESMQNKLVSERRSSMDMLLSKNFSMGVGNDNFVLPGIPYDLGLDGTSLHSISEPKGFLLESKTEHKSDPLFKGSLLEDHKSERKRLYDDFEPVPVVKRKKRRRLSSLGFLSPTFFEDHLKPSSRRNSVEPISKHPISKDEELAVVDESMIEHGFGGSIGRDVDDFCKPVDVDRPCVDPAKLIGSIKEFRSAMEKSQDSQQSLHKWDREVMGLKRSHSKTMRLSTRSRKKLRSFFKNEMNALSAKMR